jgi:hypothetical protein
MITGVLLAANIGLLWFYQWRQPRHEPRNFREDIRTKFINEVGISGTQLAVYDSLRNDHYESIGPMFKDLRMTRDSLFKLIHRTSVNDSAIASLSAEVFNKQQAIDLKIHRYFRSIRELGTEEQKPKIDSFLSRMANRAPWGNHRGPGQGPVKKESK